MEPASHLNTEMLLHCSSSSGARSPDCKQPLSIHWPLKVLGMEVEKEKGKQGKAVLIADQPELSITAIFALLILVPLHKKDVVPQPLKRFEGVRLCS